VGIGGGADIANFGVLPICSAIPAQPIIARVKWNGFDNFAGNSLSHFTTPTTNILTDSSG